MCKAYQFSFNIEKYFIFLKTTQLCHCFQDLRLQFAGAIPLSKQEKFSKNLMQLQEDKNKMEKELLEVWFHFSSIIFWTAHDSLIPESIFFFFFFSVSD